MCGRRSVEELLTAASHRIPHSGATIRDSSLCREELVASGSFPSVNRRLFAPLGVTAITRARRRMPLRTALTRDPPSSPPPATGTGYGSSGKGEAVEGLWESSAAGGDVVLPRRFTRTPVSNGVFAGVRELRCRWADLNKITAEQCILEGQRLNVRFWESALIIIIKNAISTTTDVLNESFQWLRRNDESISQTTRNYRRSE
uniref:Uncharacterized protein n=1 Tax=Steinernema glaseri TaxID=37863 RepID=A0A1I8AEJ5_9BILA